MIVITHVSAIHFAKGVPRISIGGKSKWPKIEAEGRGRGGILKEEVPSPLPTS